MSAMSVEESGIETKLLGIVAQQSRADAVERPSPGPGVDEDTGPLAQHLACNPLDALRHL